MSMLRVIVPVLVLIVVWHLAGGAEVFGRLRNLDWIWLALALFTLTLQTILSAIRWQLVARALGIALARERAIGEYFIAQLVNQTVPGGVVGDAARAVRGRHAAGLSKSAQAVIIERLAGQIALFSVLVFGLMFSLLWGSLGWPTSAEASFVMALLTAGLVVLLLAAAAVTITHLRAFLQAAARALWAPESRVRQLVLSLAIVVCNLSAFAFSARATGTILSLEAIAVLVPLVLAAMLIPVSVAGWGFREGAAAALFPIAGAKAAAGMSAGLAFGASMLVASLPGAIFICAEPKPIGTSGS
jgi:uncharacterized membrane protein YbhN (UPF0104 family)